MSALLSDLIDDIDEAVKEVERIRVNGSFKERVLHRKKKVVDSDLPITLENGRVIEGPIVEAYREFHKIYKEPGT